MPAVVRVVGRGTSVVRVVRWEGGGREVVGLGWGGVVQGGAEGRGPEGGVLGCVSFVGGVGFGWGRGGKIGN